MANYKVYENMLLRRVLDQALAMNERTAQAVNNGLEWLFDRENLIRSGLTGFETIYQGNPMSVRHYNLADVDEIELPDGSNMPVERDKHPVPLVLVPPLGVGSECFDLMPQRSLVRYMTARGFNLYVIDWGRPELEHAHMALTDYADRMFGEALAVIRKHSGSSVVSLMGYCMGGLLCLLHQGLEQDPGVRNIVTVASPIDMRGAGIVAGIGGVLNTPMKMLRQVTKWRLHQVDPAKISSSPRLTTFIFKMTNPVGSVTTYWDLVTHLWDREFVESHSTTSKYLNNMLRYPGGVLQDMAVHALVDNKLAKGKFDVGDRLADLSKIESSLLVFAGDSDHLVSTNVARKSIDVVASKDTAFHIAPGGHMGVVFGKPAVNEVWERTAQWLSSRSQ